MLVRLLLAALGLAEVLRPRETVDFWMNLAVKGGEEAQLRSWVYTAARVEGVLILLWVLTRGRTAE